MTAVLSPRGSHASAPALTDRFELDEGRVFLTGIQALMRFPLVAARRDSAAGLRAGTFISGYPGSPIGGYDLQLERSGDLLARHGIIHRPGENEELAATTLIGTQLLDRYPHSQVDGVTGIWYGKGPGLDRSGDALRHGNFAGTSRKGAVVVLSGEDHEAKSSTLPFEQEYAFAHAGIPVLYPSTVAEFVTYGVHAIEASRYSGLWVAMKLVAPLCDGGQTVDLAQTVPDIVRPETRINGLRFSKKQDNMFFPGQTVELERHVFEERHVAFTDYVRANRIDEVVVSHSDDEVGLIAAGKSFADLQQALRELGADQAALAAAGIRLIKVGSIYPVDRQFVVDAARGLRDLIVVEEKRGILEERICDALYNQATRPRVFGKTGPDGAELFPAYGTLEPDLLAERLMRVLGARFRETINVQPRLSTIEQVRGRQYDAVAKRSPNYCSGCPHNVSTKLAEGQVAWGAPGCHIFAAIMDDQPQKQIDATFPLGGEGVGWIGLSPFTDMTHVFQNQGDGSLFHSSYLNIRFSIAAGVRMTYKILFNGYVANTGAQSPVGAKDVPQLVKLLALEGVSKIAIIASDPKAYRRVKLPKIVTVHDADDVDDVLVDLAETDGVTIFLYDGECANERRRQRRRGTAPISEKYVVINEDVCENCGDCGEITNCMSLHKKDTEFGPKTLIHQSSCNQDTFCVKGDCPSFVTVHSDSAPVRPIAPAVDATDLVEPIVPVLTDRFSIYVPGVGGTGVLTLNAVLAWAAMLDGHEVRSYDQTGAAQKWGAVLSSLVLEPAGSASAGNKVGAGMADLYLAVDAMAAADPTNLDRCSPERTAAVINTGLLPSGEMIRDVAKVVDVEDLVEPIRQFCRPADVVSLDAKTIAEEVFGDYMATNVVVVGYAFQAGLLPISAASIEAAITTNGTATAQTLQAFRYGRLAYSDPERVARLLGPQEMDAAQEAESRRATHSRQGAAAYDDLLARVRDLDEESRRMLAIRISELIHFQDVAYATAYVDLVADVARRETERMPGAELAVTREVIRYLYKLMAYKDEYEVARLHLRTSRGGDIAGTFEGRSRVSYNLHPPILRRMGIDHKIRIPARIMDPAFAALVSLRRVRGTAFDVFGRDEVRREERRLVDWYRELVEEAVGQLTEAKLPTVLEIVRLPDQIRGYEDIKLRSIVEVSGRAQELRRRLHGRTSLAIVSMTGHQGKDHRE